MLVGKGYDNGFLSESDIKGLVSEASVSHSAGWSRSHSHHSRQHPDCASPTYVSFVRRTAG